MSIHYIDWAIIGLLVVILLIITVFTQKYMRSVADFLAANRVAGRYLLTVTSVPLGAITLAANWEMTYTSGLPPTWWSIMSTPVGLFLGLTGFIVYRFRQTRALTLAQFFEERYSRRFRYFAGSLSWVAGVLNFGIFPGVTSRLLVSFLGLPERIPICGLEVPSFAVIMFIYLSIAVYIACAGGQITIMVTDFLQGSLLMLIFVVIMIFLLGKFSWPTLIEGLQTGVPEGRSLINPFAGSVNSSFNVWYFLIGIFAAVYNVRSWQGNSGYNAAAKTPHEALMAGVIACWRFMATGMCILLIPLIAYAFLHLPQFHEQAVPVLQRLEGISDTVMRSQLVVPLFLREVLPIGLVGLFCAVILGTAITCDNTYLHSWGTIFIQDVISPMFNLKFSPRTHLLLLRLSIIGVALFSFLFSLFFSFKGFIYMYFALTGAIYLGGAGAVIIGGLYWSRGTTVGAWAALCVGTVLGVGGIVLQQTIEDFPIDGQWIYFIAMITSCVFYIVFSLLDRKTPPHNMDKLLHRGEYAIETDVVEAERSLKQKTKFSFKKLIGIKDEFTRFEKFLFYASFFWSMGWWSVFVIGTIVYFIFGIPEWVWIKFWWVYILGGALVGSVCTVWIFCGGTRDALRMFRDLSRSREDVNDDGTLSGGR